MDRENTSYHLYDDTENIGYHLYDGQREHPSPCMMDRENTSYHLYDDRENKVDYKRSEIGLKLTKR